MGQDLSHTTTKGTNVMTPYEALALASGGLALAAMFLGLFRKEEIDESPHEDIPSQSEIKTIWDVMVAKPETISLLCQRHHRGAIYWHALKHGWNATEALEIALSPEASAVKYDISYG